MLTTLDIAMLLGLVAFVSASYQYSLFIQEWLEDHAKDEKLATRGRRSTTAILSTTLSERCRARRGRVVVRVSIFLTLFIFAAGIRLLANRS
jgi:hypothetical protein